VAVAAVVVVVVVVVIRDISFHFMPLLRVNYKTGITRKLQTIQSFIIVKKLSKYYDIK
jgi:hypothetical protein